MQKQQDFDSLNNAVKTKKVKSSPDKRKKVYKKV